MRRMTSSNSTHSIRVPFKNCNKVQIRYGQKSFTLALEWLPKQGDNPNIVINITDTANMDPPADDVTVHQIDDGDPVDHIQSFLSTASFNTPEIPPNPQDHVTSTTNAYQMIPGQIRIGNPYPLRNPSICPSHPLANQRYVSGQAIGLGPGIANGDAAFFATHTFTPSQNVEPTTPRNSSPSMPAPVMGQPTICQCPFPNHQHEHNCSVDGPKGPTMFNRQMNFPPVQKPLPRISMLVHRDQSASNPSTQTANVGYSPAPLVRASRPTLVSQPMMPRAPSDINSAYYGQSLQTSAIPSMFPVKRLPTDDPTSRPVKVPRKRTAKAKSPRAPSPNAINHDQSLPSHLPVGGGFLATESGSYPIPMSVGKANSPVTNNATPTTPIRPSIRLVPEESSSPESVPPESAKVASPAAASTPIDQRVRSPVSFDSSLSTEELSEMNYRGVDQIIEQVARNGENLGTPVPLPKKASASSNKKVERKPPPEGKRRPGRPPKKQQIVLDASAAMPPVTGNALDSVTHPYSASNPIVCSNNIERIAASFTDVVQFDPFLTAEHYEAVANLSAPIDSGNSILWDPDCFHHFNDPFHLATPAGPMSTFPSVDPSLGLPSIPQSATEMNLYPHPLQNDSTHAPSNGGQWQVDQVSSSVITPPGSHNSLTAGETSGLTTK